MGNIDRLTVANENRLVALRVQPNGQMATAGTGTWVPVPAVCRTEKNYD